jgi:hypothetical protein
MCLKCWRNKLAFKGEKQEKWIWGDQKLTTIKKVDKLKIKQEQRNRQRKTLLPSFLFFELFAK